MLLFGRRAIKSLSLQSGGLKVFTQPQCAFKVTMNRRLSDAESVATDQGRTVCTEDGASGENHTLNTPS